MTLAAATQQRAMPEGCSDAFRWLKRELKHFRVAVALWSVRGAWSKGIVYSWQPSSWRPGLMSPVGDS